MSNVAPFERNDQRPGTDTTEPGRPTLTPLPVLEQRRPRTKRFKIALFFRVQRVGYSRPVGTWTPEGTNQAPEAEPASDALASPQPRYSDPPEVTDSGPGIHVETGILVGVEEV